MRLINSTVPDNTKTGVTHPCYYDPDINPTYLHMANHYGTAVIPARKRKPKDKAKVENAVLNAQIDNKDSVMQWLEGMPQPFSSFPSPKWDRTGSQNNSISWAPFQVGSKKWAKEGFFA